MYSPKIALARRQQRNLALGVEHESNCHLPSAHLSATHHGRFTLSDFITEYQKTGKLRISIFLVFGLTQPGIEPEFTVSVADIHAAYTVEVKLIPAQCPPVCYTPWTLKTVQFYCWTSNKKVVNINFPYFLFGPTGNRTRNYRQLQTFTQPLICKCENCSNNETLRIKFKSKKQPADSKKKIA